MKTYISNEIVIENPNQEVKAWCNKYLIYDNPDYIKKLRMGLWIGKTPKKIYNYKVSCNKYYLPFGVIKKIWYLIKNDEFKIDFKVKKIYPRSQMKLYDYQERAVQEMLKAKNGVLVSKARQSEKR